jgi:hypothetical protein
MKKLRCVAADKIQSREHAVRAACKIQALVNHSAGDYGHPADCFCSEGLQAGVIFRNDGATIAYIRRAVVDQLKRDGYSISKWFDSRTGKFKGAKAK